MAVTPSLSGAASGLGAVGDLSQASFEHKLAAVREVRRNIPATVSVYVPVFRRGDPTIMYAAMARMGNHDVDQLRSSPHVVIESPEGLRRSLHELGVAEVVVAESSIVSLGSAAAEVVGQ